MNSVDTDKYLAINTLKKKSKLVDYAFEEGFLSSSFLTELLDFIGKSQLSLLRRVWILKL